MQCRLSYRGIRPSNQRLDKSLVALQAAMEGTALVKAVFRVLKASVRCDFVNVCLRNVQTEAGNLSFRMIDSRGRDFGSEMLQGVFFREHPGMRLLMANPGIRFINTREVLAPQETLQQTRFYQECMQVIGFRHAVGMFFWNRPPRTPEAIFSLLRVEGQPDFSDAEIVALNRVYLQIDAALARVRVAENERAVQQEMHARSRRLPDAVCVLDCDLRVVDATVQAREMCALWQDGESSIYRRAARHRHAATRQSHSDWQARICGRVCRTVAPTATSVQKPGNRKTPLTERTRTRGQPTCL